MTVELDNPVVRTFTIRISAKTWRNSSLSLLTTPNGP
jgi:hypothetical protein